MAYTTHQTLAHGVIKPAQTYCALAANPAQFCFQSLWQKCGPHPAPVRMDEYRTKTISYLMKVSRHNVFVKRQLVSRKPQIQSLRSRPSLFAEYGILKYAKTHNLPVCDCVYFAQSQVSGLAAEMLVTNEIERNYIRLDIWLAEALLGQERNPEETLYNLGVQLRRFHRKGIRHGALSPHHIFICQDSNRMKLIDFEAAVIHSDEISAAYADLKHFIPKLSRYSPGYAASFINAYSDIDTLHLMS